MWSTNFLTHLIGFTPALVDIYEEALPPLVLTFDFDEGISALSSNVTTDDFQHDSVADSHAAVLLALESQLAAQLAHTRLSADQCRRLKELVLLKAQAFGIDQAACKLSKLSPMDVEILPNTIPCRGRPIPLGKLDREWLSQKFETLKKIGMLKRNLNPDLLVYGICGSEEGRRPPLRRRYAPP